VLDNTDEFRFAPKQFIADNEPAFRRFGSSAMSLVLFALFIVAAWLAVGSLVITIRRYGPAVLSLDEQLRKCSKPGNRLIRFSRPKSKLPRYYSARGRVALRRTRLHRVCLAMPDFGTGDFGQRRQFGYGLAPRPL
jgi:hypothetical protein